MTQPRRLASITAPRPPVRGSAEGLDHRTGRPLPGWFIDLESGHPCRVNPLGAMEPPYVGAFFFDKQNGVFYRADGPTAYDWALVTPAEMLACQVMMFEDFCAPAHNAMSKAELLEALKLSEPDPNRPDHLLDARRIAELGLRVHDQRVWDAGDTHVMMCRIRLEAPPPVSVFVGFCGQPGVPTRPIAVADPDMAGVRVHDPAAVGVAFDDKAGATLFGCASGKVRGSLDAPFRETHVAVRVEINPAGHVDCYVNDVLLFEGNYSDAPPGMLGPRVSFFRYGRPS